MKIKILFIALTIMVFLSGCKKYTCECTTSTWDSNTQSYTTSSSSHTVKAMTRVKAYSDCSTYETSYDTSCDLQ